MPSFTCRVGVILALKWTQRRGVRDTRVARETKTYLLLFFVRPLESRKTGICSECLIRFFFLCFHVVYIALCLVGIDHSYFSPRWIFPLLTNVDCFVCYFFSRSAVSVSLLCPSMSLHCVWLGKNTQLC